MTVSKSGASGEAQLHGASQKSQRGGKKNPKPSTSASTTPALPTNVVQTQSSKKEKNKGVVTPHKKQTPIYKAPVSTSLRRSEAEDATSSYFFNHTTDPDYADEDDDDVFHDDLDDDDDEEYDDDDLDDELDRSTSAKRVDSKGNNKLDVTVALMNASLDLANLVQAPGDPIDKVARLHQLYVDLLNEMESMEKECAKNKARADRLNEEREKVRSELSNANALRNRLEGVCRELQRENRRLKATFFPSNGPGKDSKNSLENADKKGDYTVPSSELELLRERFKSFLEQYELREEHFRCVTTSKDLELQLSDAKLSKTRQQLEEERETVTSMKSQLQQTLRTEQELRRQLSIYVDKFKQVEETLNRSNELFTTFRKEMEQMNKKTKKLEKENQTLRTKNDTMNRNIIEMAEECKLAQQNFQTTEKKRIKLEELCRALQQERKDMKQMLESGGITLPEPTEADLKKEDKGKEQSKKLNGPAAVAAAIKA